MNTLPKIGQYVQLAYWHTQEDDFGYKHRSKKWTQDIGVVVGIQHPTFEEDRLLLAAYNITVETNEGKSGRVVTGDLVRLSGPPVKQQSLFTF